MAKKVFPNDSLTVVLDDEDEGEGEDLAPMERLIEDNLFDIVLNTTDRDLAHYRELCLKQELLDCS